MSMQLADSKKVLVSPYCEVVNDTHSQLNPTIIKGKFAPSNLSQIVEVIKLAHSSNDRICIAGGRHAMGGQQFLRSGMLLDMAGMNKVLHFDEERGLLEVEGGIFWPDIIDFLKEKQKGKRSVWVISQKQTGANSLSIGGAVSANVHGRGLTRPPLVDDLEDITVVLSDGQTKICSRTENPELFSLVVGGYGLFGIIASATLRLVPRAVLQRTVEIVEAENVISRLEKRINNGAKYGDFQFAIDLTSPDFLNKGIMSTYAEVPNASVATEHRLLREDDWKDLLYLAHVDKTAAFEKYSNYYLSTNGQLYESDVFQLATYIDNYHKDLDGRIPRHKGTELITELYVPRPALGKFLKEAADLLRHHNADVIYGTVRLINEDRISFLAWATQPWACTVLNIHVEHTKAGMTRAAKIFSDLIELAINSSGSYYLTYHKYASSQQVLACYPQMIQFFAAKRKYDPKGLFNSDWYEHHLDLLLENKLFSNKYI